MGFMGTLSDSMVNIYGIALRTIKYTMKIFFHLADVHTECYPDPQILWWEHDIQKIQGGQCVRFGNTIP
jgi:hypothetical protein